LEHIAIYLLEKMNKKVSERKVVYMINLFQIIIIFSGIIIFRNSIF